MELDKNSTNRASLQDDSMPKIKTKEKIDNCDGVDKLVVGVEKELDKKPTADHYTSNDNNHYENVKRQIESYQDTNNNGDNNRGDPLHVEGEEEERGKEIITCMVRKSQLFSFRFVA